MDVAYSTMGQEIFLIKSDHYQLHDQLLHFGYALQYNPVVCKLQCRIQGARQNGLCSFEELPIITKGKY